MSSGGGGGGLSERSFIKDLHEDETQVLRGGEMDALLQGEDFDELEPTSKDDILEKKDKEIRG